MHVAFILMSTIISVVNFLCICVVVHSSEVYIYNDLDSIMSMLSATCLLQDRIKCLQGGQRAWAQNWGTRAILRKKGSLRVQSHLPCGWIKRYQGKEKEEGDEGGKTTVLYSVNSNTHTLHTAGMLSTCNSICNRVPWINTVLLWACLWCKLLSLCVSWESLDKGVKCWEWREKYRDIVGENERCLSHRTELEVRWKASIRA